MKKKNKGFFKAFFRAGNVLKALGPDLSHLASGPDLSQCFRAGNVPNRLQGRECPTFRGRTCPKCFAAVLVSGPEFVQGRTWLGALIRTTYIEIVAIIVNSIVKYKYKCLQCLKCLKGLKCISFMTITSAGNWLAKNDWAWKLQFYCTFTTSICSVHYPKKLYLFPFMTKPSEKNRLALVSLQI